MDSNAALTSILFNLQQKYNQLNRILETTKEMEQVCTDQDEVPFVTLLNVRQNTMQSIDKLDVQTKELLSRLPTPLKEKIEGLLFPSGGTITLDNPLHTNIFDTNKRNIMLLKRIIEVDKRLNKAVNKRCNL